MKVWCYDPQSGGNKIPPTHYPLIIELANAYVAQQPWSSKFKVQLRFKNHFCYLSGVEENSEAFPIGRLRYFRPNDWSLAFYAYSSESYKPCVFRNGSWQGTIEQAIETCSVYFI